MKIIATVVFTALFSINSFAARNLGKELLFMSTADGKKPAFGASYTYGSDPDGTSYLFSFTPRLATSEKAQKLRWNFYLRSTDSFLLDWSKDRTVSMSGFQLKLSDEKLEKTIEKIIKGQKPEKDGELFLVLADDKDLPVYNISISSLCSRHPENFNDLSHSKDCDEPKL